MVAFNSETACLCLRVLGSEVCATSAPLSSHFYNSHAGGGTGNLFSGSIHTLRALPHQLEVHGSTGFTILSLNIPK